MTTTARPAEGQPRGTTQRVLLSASVCCLVAIAGLAVVGALAAGSAAAAGGAVGGGVSLAFLLFGALTVANATSVSPQASLLVALTSFVFVVVVVAAVFYALEASGAVGTWLSAGWLALGVALTALTWTVALLVGHARSRIPAFDLPPRSAGEARGDDPSEGLVDRAERPSTPAEARAR